LNDVSYPDQKILSNQDKGTYKMQMCEIGNV